MDQEEMGKKLMLNICCEHTIMTARTAQNRYYTRNGLEFPDWQHAN
jgi:hypothetical protein